ncbi:MAG: ankyrin repeat domain-containing protein [Planctomycetota bacterium]|jgi:ankyrin repeat protein
MKLSLPLKLGVFVVVLFAIVVTTCVFWKPLRLLYREFRKAPYDKETAEQFVNASAMNDIKTTKSSLNKWTDINIKAGSGQTALHAAAANGHLEMVEYLIENGADVNITDEDGDTPLHYMDIEAPRFRTPEPPSREDEQNVDTGKILKIAKFLLSNGAEINKKNSRGWTPLHRLMFNKRNNPLVELFISQGAKPNAPDNDGFTPLDWAIDRKGTEEMQSTLRRHGAVLKEKYRAEIMEAAEKGNHELLKTYLSRGADINASNTLGFTPLHVAARNGHAETVKFLSENGADLEKQGFGLTPLYVASTTEVAEILIEKGADINAESSVWLYPSAFVNQTALHGAVRAGNIEKFKLLVAKGAKINKNSHDRTPLHVAVSLGNVKMARLLIENGADVNEYCSMEIAEDGEIPITPLDDAETEEMKSLLRSHGGKTGKELMRETKEK